MSLSFRTDRSGQTVQTQIRLLLEEQSDQGLHCLLFHLHHFDKISFIHQVEQLSETTGEESILLTASVSDGTLSHLGSESGKSFLDGHEDVKSQFLGYVLKSKIE